jgi:hypothetical protein
MMIMHLSSCVTSCCEMDDPHLLVPESESGDDESTCSLDSIAPFTLPNGFSPPCHNVDEWLKEDPWTSESATNDIPMHLDF